MRLLSRIKYDLTLPTSAAGERPQRKKYVWGGRWRRETYCLLRLDPPSYQSVLPALPPLLPRYLSPSSLLLSEDVSVPVCRASSATSERAGEVFIRAVQASAWPGAGDRRASCPRGLRRGLTHGFSAYVGCLSLPISDSAQLYQSAAYTSIVV